MMPLCHNPQPTCRHPPSTTHHPLVTWGLSATAVFSPLCECNLLERFDCSHCGTALVWLSFFQPLESFCASCGCQARTAGWFGVKLAIKVSEMESLVRVWVCSGSFGPYGCISDSSDLMLFILFVYRRGSSRICKQNISMSLWSWLFLHLICYFITLRILTHLLEMHLWIIKCILYLVSCICWQQRTNTCKRNVRSSLFFSLSFPPPHINIYYFVYICRRTYSFPFFFLFVVHLFILPHPPFGCTLNCIS